jgi:hypothetical protein
MLEFSKTHDDSAQDFGETDGETAVKARAVQRVGRKFLFFTRTYFKRCKNFPSSRRI